MKALRRGQVYTSKYAKTQRSTGAGPSTSRQNPFLADSQLESELGGVHPTLEDLERKNRVLRKKIDDMTDRIMNCNPTSFEKEKKAFCALRRSEVYWHFGCTTFLPLIAFTVLPKETQGRLPRRDRGPGW
jgi:hypothetical protein